MCAQLRCDKVHSHIRALALKEARHLVVSVEHVRSHRTAEERAGLAYDDRKNTFANELADFHARTFCQQLLPNQAVLEATNASLNSVFFAIEFAPVSV